MAPLVLPVHLLQKAQIDLEDVYINVFEHVERGISAPKVVHQNRKARRAQPADHFEDLFEVLRVCGFRNFKFKQFGFKAVFPDETGDKIIKIIFIKTFAGNIYGNRDCRIARVYPVAQQDAHFFPHIGVQLYNKAVFFKRRDKRIGRKQALPGANPAHQRFRTYNFSIADIAFWLDIDVEFFILEGVLGRIKNILLLYDGIHQAGMVFRRMAHIISLDRFCGKDCAVAHQADGKRPVMDAVDADCRDDFHFERVLPEPVGRHIFYGFRKPFVRRRAGDKYVRRDMPGDSRL
ncbi:MAG: hypothetical protein DELT_03088 [Desulfovibrio sp.]